jgi:hypothetical protein
MPHLPGELRHRRQRPDGARRRLQRVDRRLRGRQRGRRRPPLPAAPGRRRSPRRRCVIVL